MQHLWHQPKEDLTDISVTHYAVNKMKAVFSLQVTYSLEKSQFPLHGDTSWNTWNNQSSLLHTSAHSQNTLHVSLPHLSHRIQWVYIQVNVTTYCGSTLLGSGCLSALAGGSPPDKLCKPFYFCQMPVPGDIGVSSQTKKHVVKTQCSRDRTDNDLVYSWHLAMLWLCCDGSCHHERCNTSTNHKVAVWFQC